MHILIPDYQSSDSLTQYGDGLFETMLAVGEQIFHWEYHWQRLRGSCERLGIAMPDEVQLCEQIQAALAAESYPYAVVKMLVGRGEGLRGYRSINTQHSTVHLSVSAYTFDARWYAGLNVRICATRLASQPLLAGMKHCNKLEYILARREHDDDAYDEGLLLDYDNNLIEGLISNVFVLNGMQLTTPLLEHSGVCGTMRSYLMQAATVHGYEVEERAMSVTDLRDAASVFLTNATNGIMPVARIDSIAKEYTIGPVADLRKLMEHPSLCLSYVG